MRSSIGKLITAVALVTAVMVTLVVLVHLPPVRARIVRWGLEWLKSEHAIAARVDHVSYNLLTGDVRLQGVTLAAIGSEAAPFLTAGRLDVKLPWSVLGGEIGLQSLDVTGLRVSIMRRSDGSVNLPAGRRTGDGLVRLAIGRLALQDSSFAYRDDARDFSVEASGITARLVPQGDTRIAGPLTVATGPLIRVGGRESRATQLQGQIAFDGTVLSIERVTYEAPEGRLNIVGQLSALLASPRADLEVTGNAALSSLSSWVDLQPAARGTLAVAASMTGPLADPTASIALESDGVSWSHIPAMPLQARATLTASHVTLTSATLRLEEGALNAHGEAAFDRDEGQIHLEWRALPAASLLGPLAPFPIAARLRGSMELSWNGAEAGAWRVAANNEAEPITGGRKGIRISGRESLVAERGHWRLRHVHDLASGPPNAAAALGTPGAIRVTGEAAGLLTPAALSMSTLGGEATVSIGDLARAVPVLRGAGVAVPEWLAATRGTLISSVQLSGTIATPSAIGTARIANLYVSGVGPAQLQSDLTIDTDRASIERLEATLGANHASASGSLAFTDDAIRGAGRLELLELARFTPSWPGDWQPSGAVSASFDLGGSISNLVVEGNVDGRALTVAKQQIDELTARLEYARDSLVARSIDLRQRAGGYLAVAGAYKFSTGGYALETTGRGLTLQPLDGQGIWPAGADIDVDFDAEGTRARPAGAGRITFGRLSWRDVEIPGGEIGVDLSDLGAHAIARVPSLAATVNGTIGWMAPWSFTMSADLEDADLARLAREASVSMPPPFVSDFQGRADLTAAAIGTLEDLASSSVVVALRRFEVRANHAEMVLVRPAELQYARGRIDVRDVELRSGGTTLTSAGQLTDRSSQRGIRAEMNGDLRDVKPWLEMFRLAQPLNMTGHMAASLAGNGSLETPILTGAVSITDAGVAVSDDLPEISGVSLEGTLAEGVVDVSQIDARWQGAVLTGRARIPIGLFEPWLPGAVMRALPVPGGDATLVASLGDITNKALVPWLGAAVSERLDGRASMAVDLRAPGPDLEQVRGSVMLDQLDVSVAGVALTQVGPTRLEVANRYVRITDWTWDVAGNRLVASGGLSLAGSRDLDLEMSGLVDIRIVGAFVPDVTTGGLADLTLRVHGPLDAPSADGALQLRDAELRVADPQIAISGVAGRVLLEGQRVRLVDIEGSANGGRMLLSGELRHEGLAVTGGRVTMAGRGISLNVPQGLRTEVDTDLTLAFADDRPELSGTVAIRRGAYRESLSLAAGFVSAARQRTAVAVVAEQASWLDQVALNVEIVSAEDLIVDNNYGRMDLELDVRLVGSLDRPSVLGRAAIREGGALYLGGRVYQIENGLIDFTSQTGIVPDLDITARTRISGYDITLVIAGAPDALQGTLTSDPALAQSDIVSLLLTGRMASDIGGAETTIAREQVLGYLSGEVLGFAAQAIGLDTLRLERGGGLDGLRADPSLVAGETDPSSRLTLSKNLSRYVEVVLSQDLRESGHLTWIVSYTPRSNIEMRAVSRDDRSRSYGLNHQVSFGVPPPAAPVRGITAVPRPATIAEIRIVGTLDVPESDLRRMLKVQPGDRFDFYNWQRDRERLRRFYVEHGYLEARIGARRIDAPPQNENEIVLEYDIDRGQRTMLAISGYALPDTVVRELEAIWSNAVFDEARLADMRTRVRTYLAGEGYVRGEVTARVELPEPSAPKLIRITIVPGPRSTSREIRFAGNHVVPTDRLDALIAGTDLGILGWLDPAAVAREVEELYKNEGRLAAKVTAGPAEFISDRAALPVTIDEGPAFSIADVALAGVGATREADVRRALALEPNALYALPQVEAGRRGVEAMYRRQGFNAARVAVLTDVNPKAPAVHLTVSVEEGAQQVLQAVVIEGAEGVREEVISRALDLTPGEPVDMAAWYESRRRLLDVGLFRRVDVEALPSEQPKPAGAAAIQPVTAQVTVEPWPAWRLRYGVEMTDEAAPAGESRRFGGGLTADAQRRTLFGRAGTLGVSGRWNRHQQIGRTFLGFSNFFRLPLSSSLFLSRSRERISEEGFLAFITDKTTFTAEQRFVAGRRVRISYGYQFERNHTFDPGRDPDDPLGLDLTVRASRLTSTAVVDTRDDPFDAIRGLMHSSSFEYAPEALGSDVRFVKFTLQQFVYRQLAGRVVSASAVRIGVGRGFGQDLIPSERFFAGGGNTVRGYRDNSLGATGFFGDPRGGHSSVVLNQEARFPLFRWIRGAGFVDAGNVFGSASDLSLTDLKVGIGGGVRLATPFGLFRFDVGVPLSREQTDRTPRFYFSLGQIF